MAASTLQHPFAPAGGCGQVGELDVEELFARPAGGGALRRS